MGHLKDAPRVGVDFLVPYARNAKTHSDEQIRKIADSIKQFGFINPVLIDEAGNVIAGHGRILAAQLLGMEEVPVAYVESMTETERRAYIIADNRLAELAQWDEQILQDELDALQALDFDIDILGFEPDPEEEDEADIIEDTPPAVPWQPKSLPGHVYQLGEHRLICGDSTQPETMQKLIEEQTIDLLLTDPPYNVEVGKCDRPHSKNNGIGIMNDKMEPEQYIKFLGHAFRAADEHMRGGAAFYVWYAGLHHIEVENGIRKTNWNLHEQLIWVKSHFVMGRNSDYQWMHECCLYGWKPGKHYFTDSRAEETVIEDAQIKSSTMKKGELIELCEKLLGQTQPKTVLRADKPDNADMHPTVKPQELLTRLIKNSSRRGENVLDPFGGSGSTLIACEQLGRRCFMAEIDPKYCDVIIDRWEAFTGEKAVDLNAAG